MAQGKSAEVKDCLTSVEGLGLQCREEIEQTTAPKVPFAEIQIN